MAAFLKTFEGMYDGGIEGFLTGKLEFSASDIQTMRQNLVA